MIPRILVLGEDPNDCRAIRNLLLSLRPDLSTGQVQVRRKPLTLLKNLTAAKQRERKANVSLTLKAEAVRAPVRCVLMHEDADAFEPAHGPLASLIETTYSTPVTKVLAVVPAWEIETWWFLFPDAVAKVHGKWRKLHKFAGRDVGMIANAKEALARELRPAGRYSGHVRDYAESDSVAISQHIAALGIAAKPIAKSASWDHFVAQTQLV